MAEDVPAFDDLPSFDDLPDAPGGSTPVASAAVPRFDDLPSFDEMPDGAPNGSDTGRPAPETALGSAVRSGSRSVVPVLAALLVPKPAQLSVPWVALSEPFAGAVVGGVLGSMGTRYAQEQSRRRPRLRRCGSARSKRRRAPDCFPSRRTCRWCRCLSPTTMGCSGGTEGWPAGHVWCRDGRLRGRLRSYQQRDC